MSHFDGLPDPDEHINFLPLLSMGREDLMRELAETATTLAVLSSRIGFLRAEEIRNPSSFAKEERVQHEGTKTVYDEKKWLLIRLLGLAD